MDLCKKNNINPASLQGSYAGAIGYGQFIPSSYLSYAVNYKKSSSSDVDLLDPLDAIASVANYLSKHNWSMSEGVAYKIPGIRKGDRRYLWRSNELGKDVLREYLTGSGLSLASLSVLRKSYLLEIKSSARSFEYWLVLNNFYVITRYNHSHLYAMAVYLLSKGIKEKFLQQ